MDKSEIGLDGWPVDEKVPLDFENIVSPLVDAVRFAYSLERQNVDKDVPWSGPSIGRNERACCFDAKEKLSSEILAGSEDEQGRDPLTEIIGLAVLLGIEQGRRIIRSSPEYHILELEAKFGSLKP